MRSLPNPTPAEIKVFKSDPAQFRSFLLIRQGDGVVRFKPDPWQAENLAVLDPLWKKVAGVPQDGRIPKFAWLGRPRGHSKTMDEAMQLVWVLAFSRKHLNGIAAAGSKDQAKFIRDAVERILLLNSWLGKNGLDLIRVQNYRVFNPKTRSEVDIISSDAPSSFGATPDFVLCDELTHWKNDRIVDGKEESLLWTSLFSSAAKVPHCVLVIMTNAGYERTWQANVRDVAIEESRHKAKWIYRNLDGPCASWMGVDFLEDQRKGISRKSFYRLWLNKWQTEAGDALDEGDIQACTNADASPMNGDEEGWAFIAGLDLATMKHRSAFVVLGIHSEEHRIKLAYTRSWKPGAESGMVNLDQVKNEIISLNERYRLRKLLFDPSQALLMGQQFEQAGIWCEQMKFADPKSLTLMAVTILDVFKSRRIEMYPNQELLDDLKKLDIVERSGFSFKIEAKADSTGHADTAIALAIALPEAVNMAAIPRINPFVTGSLCRTLDELDPQEHDVDDQKPALVTDRSPIQRIVEENQLKLEEEPEEFLVGEKW